MKTQFVFEHIATSRGLKDYAKSRLLGPIEKFSTKPVSLRLAFRPDGDKKVAHCQFFGGDGMDVNLEAKSENFYAAIDSLEKKLRRKLSAHKEKIKAHHGVGYQHHNLNEGKGFSPPDREELIEESY